MSKEIKEPVFEKNEPDKRHYKELSFGDYIRIQFACQEVANRIGYPIYLVGGALKEHTPRDIDISIIVPHEEYYDKYINGHNEITNPEYQAFHFMNNAYHIEFENLKELTAIMFEWIMLDIKICPDNWFTDKPKMLLAKPRLQPNKDIEEAIECLNANLIHYDDNTDESASMLESFSIIKTELQSLTQEIEIHSKDKIELVVKNSKLQSKLKQIEKVVGNKSAIYTNSIDEIQSILKESE